MTLEGLGTLKHLPFLKNFFLKPFGFIAQLRSFWVLQMGIRKVVLVFSASWGGLFEVWRTSACASGSQMNSSLAWASGCFKGQHRRVPTLHDIRGVITRTNNTEIWCPGSSGTLQPWSHHSVLVWCQISQPVQGFLSLRQLLSIIRFQSSPWLKMSFPFSHQPTPLPRPCPELEVHQQKDSQALQLPSGIFLSSLSPVSISSALLLHTPGWTRALRPDTPTLPCPEVPHCERQLSLSSTWESCPHLLKSQ